MSCRTACDDGPTVVDNASLVVLGHQNGSADPVERERLVTVDASAHNAYDGEEPMKVKKLNRWRRLHAALKAGRCTSMDIIYMVGTVTPSKCVSELRAHGVIVKSRMTKSGVKQYWCGR